MQETKKKENSQFQKDNINSFKKEIKGIMKIIKSSEEFDLLIKGVTKTI